KFLNYVDAEKIKRIDFQHHAKENSNYFYVTSALNDANAYCFDKENIKDMINVLKNEYENRNASTYYECIVDDQYLKPYFDVDLEVNLAKKVNRKEIDEISIKQSLQIKKLFEEYLSKLFGKKVKVVRYHTKPNPKTDQYGNIKGRILKYSFKFFGLMNYEAKFTDEIVDFSFIKFTQSLIAKFREQYNDELMSIFNNFGELITDNISKIIDDNVYNQKQLLRLIYCKKYSSLPKCYANV